MIKLDYTDVFAGLKKVNTKSITEIKDDFKNKNRTDIYDCLISILSNTYQDEGQEVALTVGIEFVYHLWRNYYENCKFSKDTLGDNVDFAAMDDDIIRLLLKNMLDKLGKEQVSIQGDNLKEVDECISKVMNEDELDDMDEKCFDDKIERLQVLYKENNGFVYNVTYCTNEYYQGQCLIGSIIAFYALEEAMKKINGK